jgi:hypothetical protein
MNGKWFCIFTLLVAMVSVVSADTLILSPDLDGYLPYSTNNTWANIRALTSSGTPVTNADNYLRLRAVTASPYFDRWYRSAYSFNTSQIPAGATVTGVIFKTRLQGRAVTLAVPDVGITGGVLASNTSLATGDMDGWYNTELSNRITLPASGNWMNFTFNAAGISYVQNNMTGSQRTILFPRLAWDIDNSMPVYVNGGETQVDWNGQEDATTTRRPTLEITYTTTVTPVASFTCTKNFIRIPNSVTCTDTSTNTPTSWSWNWGDGSSASTTQNPSHTYTKRGKWDIVLTATNAGGSNTTAATAVKVIGYENYW